MTDQEKMDDLRRAIRIGIEQADRGEGEPITATWVEEVKKRGRERRASRDRRPVE